MLEVFTKSLLELVNIVLKNRQTTPKISKAGRTLLRMHWMLGWMETYSRDFVDGVDILISEQRISSRLTYGLKGLSEITDELCQLVTEDSGGFHTGFWQVTAIFDAKLVREFHAIVGAKCHRIRSWSNLLTDMLKNTTERGDVRFIYRATRDFEGPPILRTREEYDSEWKIRRSVFDRLVESGQLQKVEANDTESLRVELDDAIEIIHRIRATRENLGEFIKQRYSINDLL